MADINDILSVPYKLTSNGLHYIAQQFDTLIGVYSPEHDGSTRVSADDVFVYGVGGGVVELYENDDDRLPRDCPYVCDISYNSTLSSGTWVSNISLNPSPEFQGSFILNGTTNASRFLEYVSMFEYFYPSLPTSVDYQGAFYPSPCRITPNPRQWDWYNESGFIPLSSLFSYPRTPEEASNVVYLLSRSNLLITPCPTPLKDRVYVQNNYPPSVYNTHTGTSGDSTFNYYYDNNTSALYLNPVTDFNFDDLADFFNNVLIPYISADFPDIVAPSVSFPNFDELQPVPDPPFAYIAPIHELNYYLHMPDASEYLDVQTISKPLSICSDGLSYMWNAITSLGLAPVLGFCLVATLIVKGLRGD